MTLTAELKAMQTTTTPRSLRGLAIALAALGLAMPAAHAVSYLDTDGATGGFQAANGATYAFAGNYWNPNSSGIGTLTTFALAGGGPMTFGTNATDLAGLSFLIDTTAGTAFGGIAINSDSATVTLIGTGNNHPGSSWTVAAGSTLNQNNTYGGNPGMNWQSAAVTLAGGGTINLNKMLGFNSGGLITENDAGAGLVVNLKAAGLAGGAVFSGGYTLTSGTLNFATAASANAFVAFNTAAKPFKLNGGTLDNTSGSAMTLTVGTAGYSIDNNFTFAGSSDLNLGTAKVVLTGTRQLTVNQNTLTVGGVISGSNSTYGITKAGDGTLALTNANTYTGATTVDAGTLKLTGGSLANTAIAVTGTGTLAVQPGSATAISAGTTGAGSAGATLDLGGQTFDMTDGAVSTFNLQQQDSFASTALTIADGATLKFNLSNSTADRLAVTRTASVSGTVYLTVDTTGATLLSSSYTLVTAAAGLTDAGWQFTGGGTTKGVTIGATNYTLTLHATDAAITLSVVSEKPPTTTTLASSANPSANGQSVTFTATVTAGATGSVEFYDGVTALGTEPLNGSIPNHATFTTSGLATGTHSITAIYEGNSTFGSSSSGAVSQGVKPAAPTGLTATPANHQVTLSWTAPAGATSYTVKRLSGDGGSVAETFTTSETSYTEIGLTNGLTYYYVVAATNTPGDSPDSTQASVVVQVAAPTGLAATAGNTQVSLTWTAPLGATGYDVKQSLTGGEPYTTIATNIPTASYMDTGLTNGTTYYYVVSAINSEAEVSVDSTPTNATPVMIIAGNGTPYYLDTDGATARFQASDGVTYNFGDSYWNPNGSGIGTLAALTTDSQITIGTTSSDFAGQTFSINDNTGLFFKGLVINSGSVHVNLVGTGWFASAGTWTVATGSLLSVSGNYAGNPGMNYNGNAITLAGGGTLDFNTMLGFHSAGLWTQHGPTVNLKAASLSTDGASGGYTLTSGTLNFANALAANTFQNFTSGKRFAINGGTLDNTTGSAMNLSVGAGAYRIGGSFTFAGSSDLDFGPNAVDLTTTPTITVTTNQLTIGGSISGSGFGMAKAGAGTLTLSGTNSYDGNTTVSEGVLSISNAYLASASTVTIATDARLDLNFSGTNAVSQLIIGTDPPLADGVYGALDSGAPNEIGQLTGSGTLTVSAVSGSGYAGWADANGVTGGVNGDSNHDGVQNGIAYFMNDTGLITNPELGASNTVTWTNGGQIPDTDYGTQFVVQTSTNLVDWTPVDAGDLTTNTSGPGGELTYTLPPGEVGGKLFVRLMVTPN
ncbi:MAG: Ig-like domain repeat protein [Verrucomicrobia bacterium]|nr:Ig-like domain repeat protein [Verrucomicrobiota bacterium]